MVVTATIPRQTAARYKLCGVGHDGVEYRMAFRLHENSVARLQARMKPSRRMHWLREIPIFYELGRLTGS